jgi:hypothetical protein
MVRDFAIRKVWLADVRQRCGRQWRRYGGRCELEKELEEAGIPFFAMAARNGTCC